MMLSAHQMKKYLPKGLTKQEAAWWALVLGWDFPNRKKVLRSLQLGELTITSKYFSTEFAFDNVACRCRLSTPDSEILEVKARNEFGEPVCACLSSWRHKVDSLYVYTLSGYRINLDLSAYSDFEYEVADYLILAEKRIERLYETTDKTQSVEDVSRMLAPMAESGRKSLTSWLMKSIRGIPGCESAEEYNSGPFSVSVRIPLGKLDGKDCVGVVRISLLGLFHCAYVVEYGSSPRTCYNYPNGESLFAVREMLHSRGYLPLSRYQLERNVDLKVLHTENAGGTTVKRCLFTGQGILE